MRLLFVGFLASALCLLGETTKTLPLAVSAPQLSRQAALAAQAGDHAAFLKSIRQAVALAPTHPTYRYNLACALALNGDPAGALDNLKTLGAWGLVYAPERDPDLASLISEAGWSAVISTFEANRQPQGRAETRQVVPSEGRLWEGIAFDPASGTRYFSDLHQRSIWREMQDEPGKLSRFSAPDAGLLGPAGLALDPIRGVLWVACMAVPEMSGYRAEQPAEIVGLSLAGGNVLWRQAAPPGEKPTFFGDVRLGPDTRIYASDSGSGVVWSWLPGESELRREVDFAGARSLQGFDFTAEGKHLVAADYSTGLWALDLKTGQSRPLATGVATTLLGIDGFYRMGGGWVAVQNGVNPSRLLYLEIDEDCTMVTRVTVALANHPEICEDPTLGYVDRDQFTFIGTAGWAYFGPRARPEPADRSAKLLAVRLPPELK